MDPLAHRVARRFQAGLVEDLTGKLQAFLRDEPLDGDKAIEIAHWLEQNFYFLTPKTPKGQKALKELVNKLHWWMKAGVKMHGQGPGLRNTIEDIWKDLEPKLSDLAKYFSAEGGKVVPKELKLGGNTFINVAGFEEKKLHEYATRLEAIFKDLRGWRKKALGGGVTVVLASPKEFHGTAGGKYRSEGDQLLVRATPDVLKRSGSSYGSFEYIIVHELGHRYERKHHVPVDFDKQNWWTSKYSRNEGESFAELFALSNFGTTGQGDPETLERFEAVMAGRDDPARPELPSHLKHLV